MSPDLTCRDYQDKVEEAQSNEVKHNVDISAVTHDVRRSQKKCKLC